MTFQHKNYIGYYIPTFQHEDYIGYQFSNHFVSKCKYCTNSDSYANCNLQVLDSWNSLKPVFMENANLTSTNDNNNYKRPNPPPPPPNKKK